MRHPALTLESILVGRGYADLATASPLQLALARAADGRPVGDALERDDLTRHFGVDALPSALPSLVVVVAGVRGGKTLLSVCAALKCAMTADLRALKRHEVPRFAIVAPTVDNATAGLRMLVGIVRASPVLRRMVVGDPTADSITIRRRDGREVEVVVVAASRGAVTLRSRWLVGFALDEVAGFGAESAGYTINAEELLRAGETRLVPLGQGWVISSPFGPQGLLHDLWKEHFGKPGRVLVCHAPTRALNPSFPQEQVEAIRRRDPDAAAREYDALWVDPVSALLEGKLLDAATRAEPALRPRALGARYVAAMDPASRVNSWTLVVGHAEAAGAVHRVVLDGAWEWRPTPARPLKPDVVLGEVADVLARYGLKHVLSDQWSNDAIKALARARGLSVRECRANAEELVERYTTIRTLLQEGRIELPPNPTLRSDLAAVRRRVTNAVRIELGRTPDGRHSDFAPAVALVAAEVPSPSRSRSAATTDDARPGPNHWEREADAAAGRRNGRRVSGGPWSWFGGGRGF